MCSSLQRLFALGLFVLAACGGASAGEDSTTPVDVTRYEGPIGSTDAALGQERFVAACSFCHGENAEGDTGPALTGIGWSAARVRQRIREGSGRMRPISARRLSDADMEAVLAHLVTIGTVRAD